MWVFRCGCRDRVLRCTVRRTKRVVRLCLLKARSHGPATGLRLFREKQSADHSHSRGCESEGEHGRGLVALPRGSNWIGMSDSRRICPTDDRNRQQKTFTTKTGIAQDWTEDQWFGLRMKAAMCLPVPFPCVPSSVASHFTSPRFRTSDTPMALSIISTHLSTG